MSGVSGLLFIHVRKAARWGENDFTKCVCVRIYVKEIVLQTHAGSLLLTFQKVCTRFKEKSWEPSDAKMRLRGRKDTDQPEKPQILIDFCNSLYSIVNSECVIGLRRLWLACADAQAIQGLRSPHLFQVHFSHGDAHVYYIYFIIKSPLTFHTTKWCALICFLMFSAKTKDCYNSQDFHFCEIAHT